MDENELIKKKVDYFWKNKIVVHIKFKNGYWKRGVIKEIKADFFMLLENLEGMMPIFFQEIESIEQFVDRKGRMGG